MISKPIFENSDFIAINKAIGVDIHNSENSILNQLQKELNISLFPVHRLDKETSGCLLLAKNKQTASELAKLFQENQIAKFYCAVVKKNPKFPFAEKGIWSQSMSNKAEGRKNPLGKKSDWIEAETHFIKTREVDHYAFLEIELMTGRTHQIRKHCATNFCPIVGDERYGNSHSNEIAKSNFSFHRMALHCTQLRFSYKQIDFNIAAEIPQDFLTFFAS